MIKNTIFITILLSIISLEICAQNIGDALNYIKDEQYLRAKEYLIKNKTSLENNNKYWYYLGKVYFINGKIDSAEYCFNQGLIFSPKEQVYTAGKAGVALNKNSNEEAFRLFEKLLKTAKNNIETLLEGAQMCIYGKVKNFEIADKFIKAATDLNSRNPEIHLVSGEINMNRKQIGAAKNDFERVLFFDSKNYLALVKIARIHANMKNYWDAIDLLTKAISIDTTRILAYKEIAELKYTTGKYDEAIYYFKKYLESGEYSIDTKKKYSYALFFNKDYKESENIINELLLIEPNDPILMRLKSYIDYETGHFTEGLNSIQKFFQVQDSSKTISEDYIYYGRLLVKNNFDTLGAIQLEKGLKLDTSKTELYDEIAKLYSKNKKYEIAIKWQNQILDHKLKSPENVYYQIGREYYFWAEDKNFNIDSLSRINLFKKADSSFSNLLIIKNESLLGHLFRARVRVKLDPETELGLAKEDYEQIIMLTKSEDIEKNKKTLIEAYRYLAYYFYMQNENNSTLDNQLKEKNAKDSLQYWQNIIDLNPDDTQAKVAIENLKK